MSKTLAVYYGGVFLVIMALNLHTFIVGRNTAKTSLNPDTPSLTERSSQASQPTEYRGSGRGGA